MKSHKLRQEEIDNLQLQFPGGIDIIGRGSQEALLLQPNSFLRVMDTLRHEQTYQFNMLTNLTAVDYLQYFELIYHLYSLPLRHNVTIKIRCGSGEGIISSVTAIWPSADFQEREVYDLLGIFFIGHKDLRRILLPEDFIGHPLRKDYKQLVPGERRS